MSWDELEPARGLKKSATAETTLYPETPRVSGWTTISGRLRTDLRTGLRKRKDADIEAEDQRKRTGPDQTHQQQAAVGGQIKGSRNSNRIGSDGQLMNFLKENR